MKKNPAIILGHILESIDRIEGYMIGKTQDDLSQSVALQDKILYRLAVIGEASNALPKEIQSQYDNIPWRDIVGLRNIVIHEYYGVSLDEVFDTVTKDLPVLKIQVEAMVAEISQKASEI